MIAILETSLDLPLFSAFFFEPFKTNSILRATVNNTSAAKYFPYGRIYYHTLSFMGDTFCFLVGEASLLWTHSKACIIRFKCLFSALQIDCKSLTDKLANASTVVYPLATKLSAYMGRPIEIKNSGIVAIFSSDAPRLFSDTSSLTTYKKE